ncbi:hypothetical protein B0H14DRAFT_2602175 [Mycena olivaceomarginata]|nr:hypothetical protein B0H14DRAFT_2602175 [Mycena olivaceomarginata]
MRSIIAIRKRRSVIPSLLPPSSSPPHPPSTLAIPSLLHPPSTARNIFGMQPVLYGSAEVWLTPALPVQLIIVAVRKNPPLTSIHTELLLSHWSYSESRDQCGGGGAHKMWRLAGASRRNASDTDLGMLKTCAVFLRRTWGRHGGAHWVHMHAEAQLRALARQYGNHMTIYYVFCIVYATIYSVFAFVECGNK